MTVTQPSQAGSLVYPTEDKSAAVNIYLPLLSRGYVLYQESTGILDASFGGDGRVLTDLSETDDEGLSIAIQRDGKLVVGGEVDTALVYDIDLLVARYNLDGSLDTAFGDHGWVRTDLDGWDDTASDITLQADGKILQSGTSKGDFVLVRYNPDGSLDTTFSGDGWVRTDFWGYEDESKAVAVQPDGSIIVAGYAMRKISDYIYQYDFALVRYLVDGSLDPGFGEDGRVTTDLTGDQDRAQALAIQPDGKIILAGPAKHSPYLHDFAVARYLPDGSLDTEFGTGGWLFTDFEGGHDFAYAIALLPDGRILVAGTATMGGQEDFALARYTASGLLDISFDGDGRVTTDFAGGDDDIYGLVLQPDGNVIAAGYAFDADFDFAVARYNPSGSLDASFAGDGSLVTDLAGGDDLGLAVVLQPDGRIVVAGNAVNTGNIDFALVRYK